MTALDLIRTVTGTVEPFSSEPYRIVNGALVYVARGAEELDLYNKGLKDIRCRLPTGLKKLYLNGNQIKEIQPGVLPKGLKKLWLNGNQIKEIRPSVLPAGLKRLALNRNPLVKIWPKALPVSLERLELYGVQAAPGLICVVQAELPRCKTYATDITYR